MSEAVWYCPLCQAEGFEAETQFCSNDGARVRPLTERGAEWIGKVLADRYHVLRFIDAGGTAEVYEAERLGTGKRVALKVLHQRQAERPEAGESFQREARMVSLIAHPNVVAIDDFGTLPSGNHYMVMELLDGKPMSAHLAAGPLPLAAALKYAMQACEGLAAAHAREVLHCDIKPGNLILHRVQGSPDPVVKILDLGIGRMLAASGNETAGVVSGTPEYMSPEQAQGRPLQAAADIYSMGITVWEMLLGTLPFDHESYLEVLQMQVRDKPAWPTDIAAMRGVPLAAGEVLLKALAKDPADRHGSMLDLQTDLASIAREVRARTNLPPRGTMSDVARPPPSSLPQQRVATPRPIARSGPPSSPRSTTIRRVLLAEATGADDQVVELAPDVYWVGRRRGQLLECNAFLRVFRKGGMEVRVLVDPGPPEDYAILKRKIESVIGSIDRLDYVFLNHQDPDVASNAASIQQASRHTRVICSEDTFRLARFYGLDPKRFIAVESFAGGIFALPTGHTIVFVPTPFCHFRGATMLFDPESRVLFSGDLFGGARSSQLVANERSWAGIEMFHQIYMPSQRALGLAAGRVQRLTPSPTLIAPQHGGFFVGDEVESVVERVGRLEVGLDLPDSPSDETQFVDAANDIAREYEEIAGADRTRELLAGFATDASFTRLFALDAKGRIASFKVAPRLALEALANDALASLAVERRGDLRRAIQLIMRQHELEPTHSSPGSVVLKAAPPRKPND